MYAVHAALPPRHDPFLDLLPDTGVKLTPKHYAYLKISEGCNHRCSFCIIPSMRGDLVSRPVDEVLREAEKLALRRRAGTAGDLAGHQRLRRRREIRRARLARQVVPDADEGAVRRPGRTRRVDAPALRLSVSARGRHHPADGRGQVAAVPGHPVPARQPAHPETDEAPGRGRQDARTHPALARRSARRSPSAAPSSSAFPARPKPSSSSCWISSTRPSSIASAPSPIRRWKAPRPTRCPIRCRRK